MALLTCSCLNVSVYITNNARQQAPIAIKNLFSGECENVLRSGSGVLYEVDLDVAGIVVVSILLCLFPSTHTQHIHTHATYLLFMISNLHNQKENNESRLKIASIQ